MVALEGSHRDARNSDGVDVRVVLHKGGCLDADGKAGVMFLATADGSSALTSSSGNPPAAPPMCPEGFPIDADAFIPDVNIFGETNGDMGGQQCGSIETMLQGHVADVLAGTDEEGMLARMAERGMGEAHVVAILSGEMNQAVGRYCCQGCSADAPCGGVTPCSPEDAVLIGSSDTRSQASMSCFECQTRTDNGKWDTDLDPTTDPVDVCGTADDGDGGGR